MLTPQYLLILACSQRKRSNSGLIPAIERYDGVNFRVIRKARREGYWPTNLEVLILSARFGLLKPNVAIADYDLRMTKYLATAMRSTVEFQLIEGIKAKSYTEIFVNLGRDYLLALGSWETALPPWTTVIYARGGIGQKASQMRNWLIAVADSDGRAESYSSSQ
jgi:hypothetical protein